MPTDFKIHFWGFILISKKFSLDELTGFLKDAGCSERVIEHCLAVRNLSVKYAREIPDADLNLVEAGAVLHDIGRSVTHGIAHAQIGADICRKLGFSEDVCLIVERHIGAGLPAAECAELGLDAHDCIPLTLEEKIVAHCDNLVKGANVISIGERMSLAEKSGLSEKARERIAKLSDEIEGLRALRSEKM